MINLFQLCRVKTIIWRSKVQLRQHWASWPSQRIHETETTLAQRTERKTIAQQIKVEPKDRIGQCREEEIAMCTTSLYNNKSTSEELLKLSHPQLDVETTLDHTQKQRNRKCNDDGNGSSTKRECWKKN